MKFNKLEIMGYSLFGAALCLWVISTIFPLPRFMPFIILALAMVGLVLKIRSTMEADDRGAEYKRQKKEEDAIAERLAQQKPVYKIPSKKRRKLRQ